jgi:hypothetical protein
MRGRNLIGAAVAAVVLAACGGGSDDADAGADAGTETDATAPAEALADVVSIETAVDVSLAEADFTAVDDPVPVAAGDVVRTDGTGFAEVAYFDGSVTRLDVNTSFTVVELADDEGGSVVRTDMTAGRTWNRVEELAEGDEFVVETSVATATVQGTAFAIECPDDTTCTFTVVEGVVTLELPDGSTVDVVAPSAVKVAGGVAEPPVAVPFDGAFGDPWLVENADLDAAAGFPAKEDVYEAHGPAFGSLDGTFAGTRTVTELACPTICSVNAAPVGDVAERTYTFAIDCSAGVPCIGTVETQYNHDLQTLTENVPLTFDGSAYRWHLAYSSGSCGWDDNGDGVVDRTTGNVDVTIDWTMTPTTAEGRDGKFTITAMEGSATAVNTVTDTGGCTDGWMGDTNTGVISVSR